MSDPYATMPAPPAAGEFPDRFLFQSPGQSVEGVLRDVRMTSGGDYDPCPVMEVQTAQIGPDGHPIVWSVFCNPQSLWRQLTALRPPVGSMVRVTFTGMNGRAKVFQLDVAPPNGAVQAPVQQAPVAQQPAPGFPPAEAYAPQPQAPQQGFAPPTNPAAPPWGQ